MKKRAFGLAVAASLAALSASAADLPSRRSRRRSIFRRRQSSPGPESTSASILAAAGSIDTTMDIGWRLRAQSNTGGVIGGAQIGYNYQVTPLFVVGLETDFQGSSVGGGGNQGWGATRSVDWFGTVRGRAGVSMLNAQLLLYGTGGFAYGDLRLNYGWLGSQARAGTGWTAGGGLEYAFLPNWSAKVEYLYTNIGANYDPIYIAPFIVETQQRAHLNTVRAGVNYRFNWMLAPPGPAMANY